MKNIADVNSDDILTELNNLDYDDDDLQLLDDEDIKPINNKTLDDDLADFYMDYSDNKNSAGRTIDLYTEKPKQDQTPEPVVDKKVDKVLPTKPAQTIDKPSSNIDTYLNRPKVSEVKANSNEYVVNKPSLKDAVNPLINKVKGVSQAPRVESRSEKLVQNSVKSDIKDLNQLFDKVSSNVKGASEIVNRNAEIKRKMDERFEELRRLQQEHEANKRSDYEQINAYKEDVYNKLLQKKADMEKDLMDLRNSQEKFEADKKTFEEYKNTSLANLKALEKELKDSYDNRNKNIEQVEFGLVKRKEQLDVERTNLAIEREEIEKERAELAESLLQFNKIVDEFNKGMNNLT